MQAGRLYHRSTDTSLQQNMAYTIHPRACHNNFQDRQHRQMTDEFTAGIYDSTMPQVVILRD